MAEPAKFILLTEWGARHYSPAPSDWVLRKWCRNREIQPPPQKVGGEWMVREDAVRVQPQRKEA